MKHWNLWKNSKIKINKLKKNRKELSFVTNSNCLIPVSLQSNDVNLWYFTLRLFGLTKFIVWNIKGHTTLGTKDIEIRKVEFVTKTQFLWQNSKSGIIDRHTI